MVSISLSSSVWRRQQRHLLRMRHFAGLCLFLKTRWEKRILNCGCINHSFFFLVASISESYVQWMQKRGDNILTQTGQREFWEKRWAWRENIQICRLYVRQGKIEINFTESGEKLTYFGMMNVFKNFLFGWFGGHAQKCSGFISSSMFRITFGRAWETI